MNQTVDEKILEQIRPYITDKLDVLPDDVTLEADLPNDLGADSLDTIEIIMEFERKFSCSIPEEQQEKIRTIGDVIDNVKITSTLGWIRNGQVQPAKKTVAPKAAKPAQKPAIQKPSAKENMVILTNVPGTAETPTKLNCGKITEEQKQNFLASITQFDPESINSANLCGFNLYYDHFYVWVTPFNIKRNYKSKNRRNVDKEMIIQIMPERPPECGASIKGECPKYLADGKCTSPLVKQTVGALLFPDKYGKER